MSIDNWLEIIGMIIALSGSIGGIVWSNVRKEIDRKISEYDQRVQTEKIHDLQDENKRLRDRVNQTK